MSLPMLRHLVKCVVVAIEDRHRVDVLVARILGDRLGKPERGGEREREKERVRRKIRLELFRFGV